MKNDRIIKAKKRLKISDCYRVAYVINDGSPKDCNLKALKRYSRKLEDAKS